MTVSINVAIMTTQELSDKEQKAFQRGVERGKFEAGSDLRERIRCANILRNSGHPELADKLLVDTPPATPQECVQEIVNRMRERGYPVEMTHKSGFRKDHIPTQLMGSWESHFEENFARCLVEGYESKSAFVALIQCVRR